MNSAFRSLILLCTIVFSQCQSNPNYFSYRLYTDTNYKGKTLSMTGSSMSCVKIRISGANDNQMSSYEYLSGRKCIRFYENDKCSGSYFEGTTSRPTMPSGWNDDVRSYSGCNPLPPTTTTRPTTTTTRPTTTTTRPTTTTTRRTTTTTRPTTTTTRPTTTTTPKPCPTCPTCPTTPPPPTCPTTKPPATCPPPPTCPTPPPPPTCPTLPPPPTCPTLPPPTTCPICPTLPPPITCPTCPTLPPPTTCPICPTLPSPTTTFSSTTVSTTGAPGTPFECKMEGYWADTKDCSKFHSCTPNPNGGWIDREMSCPATLVFCQRTRNCDYNSSCPCNL